MNFRKKIFQAFEIEETTVDSENSKNLNSEDKFYSYDDPFDFYRRTDDSKGYVPQTQRGLRKAFVLDLIGIEFFIEMATSLRPLADEAQDINEITRLLSQQKLTTSPNLHSVTILRNLIKEPNPEIALYAAEGLNSIENSFIEKIQRIKKKISKKKGKVYILRYILGLLYLKFAILLEGQNLIQIFYLKESLLTLKEANSLKQNNRRILNTLGDVFMMLKNYKTSTKIFTHLFLKDKSDRDSLLKLAECYYKIGDYQNVRIILSLAAKSYFDLDETTQLLIYQWSLNI